jgi:hypothetical protein
VRDPERDIWGDAVNLDNGSIHNGSKVIIEANGPTLVVIIMLVVVIAACGLVMGLNLGKQAEDDRQFRDLQVQVKLLERRAMDLEAYAELNGLKVPGDDSFGPTGNLKRMVPKK